MDFPDNVTNNKVVIYVQINSRYAELNFVAIEGDFKHRQTRRMAADGGLKHTYG